MDKERIVPGEQNTQALCQVVDASASVLDCSSRYEGHSSILVHVRNDEELSGAVVHGVVVAGTDRHLEASLGDACASGCRRCSHLLGTERKHTPIAHTISQENPAERGGGKRVRANGHHSMLKDRHKSRVDSKYPGEEERVFERGRRKSTTSLRDIPRVIALERKN